MPASTSIQSVQRTVRDGDRARRRQRAVALVGRLAPAAAALACVAAAVAMLVGGSRFIGFASLAAAALVLGVVTWLARRDRPLTDSVVSELDQAAGLEGALRSAHWFAESTPPSSTLEPSRPDAKWIEFHLDTAAARAEAVDWLSVYARPRVRGAVLTTAALALGALLVSAWPEAVRATLFLDDVGKPAATGTDTSAIPSALMPQLVEGMRAMKAGRPASAEALAAIGQALEIAKDDAAMRQQLDRLFAQAGEYGDDPGMFEESREGYELRAQAEQGNSMDPSLQWAYQEAAAKASAEGQAPKDGAAESSEGGESAEGAEGAEGEDAGAEAGLGSPSATAEAATEGQVATFSSLLFGKQPSGGDGKGAPAAGKSNTAALMAALQREIVNAQRDVAGAGDGRGERRTTNATSGRPNAVSGTIGTAYERARATRPPAVPDARRPAVHEFFARPAEAGAVGSKP